MLKPDLIEFKPKELAKSEEVNYNFTQMGNYVFGTADELKALINSTVANITMQLNQFVFTGMIIPYAGKVENIPIGWLLCDGREVSRETYRNLYNKIGTKYGKGNGSTTFNLPNYIGRFLEGGKSAGTRKEAGVPNITAYFTGGSGGASSCGGACIYSGDTSGGQSGGGYRETLIKFDASRSNSIYGKSGTVQPPSVTVLYIIKT